MPKKKKKIVHLHHKERYIAVSLCGTVMAKIRCWSIHSDEKIKRIDEALAQDQRICHKCKHIHKLNLLKKYA